MRPAASSGPSRAIDVNAMPSGVASMRAPSPRVSASADARPWKGNQSPSNNSSITATQNVGIA